VDGRTVEILRMCATGDWVRLIRRSAAQPNELVLEITEQRSDGRRFERRLVLEKR
jgi:EAL domain-containing protein (putative c-di-GMP-specific phosphodiesterase class I)